MVIFKLIFGRSCRRLHGSNVLPLHCLLPWVVTRKLCFKLHAVMVVENGTHFYAQKISSFWESTYRVLHVIKHPSTHSLTRAFASCSNILWALSYWPSIIWSFLAYKKTAHACLRLQKRHIVGNHMSRLNIFYMSVHIRNKHSL